MEQHKATSLRSLSLQGFMASVSKNVDPDNAKMIRRYVQRGVFEEMWGRASSGSDVSNLRTYSNVGMMSAALFAESNGKPSVPFKRRITSKPLIGHIRAKQEFHEDVRFIMTVVDGQVYLLMDNAATDNKLNTVMCFDTEAECFVDHEALIDFALSNDILL